ncbi:MAG: enoyl-CoA hydratase/isomerase family protein, partial [Acidimicrobiales bacterium]|nr:enoyl-CoA hydratase/isomerase family protein [Acidimicrobiales bacterium]
MSDDAEPHLLFDRTGPGGAVAVVTLNRPERRNALSMEMMARMYDAWVEIDENPDIRAAVVTGAGGDFCSGMDLKAFAGGFEDDPWQQRMAADPDLHWKALLRHFKPNKPLIAAVEGFALAGGTEILQAHDIRVAGESAVFGITEVCRGLFPLGGSTVRLSRQIPYTLAAEYLL